MKKTKATIWGDSNNGEKFDLVAKYIWKDEAKRYFSVTENLQMEAKFVGGLHTCRPFQHTPTTLKNKGLGGGLSQINHPLKKEIRKFACVYIVHYLCVIII